MGLIQVTYADRRVRTSHIWHDFTSLGIPDEDVRMHYSYWVLESATGPILIDTGFHVPDSYWVGDAVWRSVPTTLAAVGVDPHRVRTVVLTHYHFDHAGHVDLFPNAAVVVARAEHEHWIGQDDEALRAGFVLPEHIEAILAAERDGRLRLIDGDTRLDGIRLIPAPGHTAGQLAALVETPSGPRLLASDAAHFFEQIERGWHFFAHADAAQTDRSITELRRIAAEANAELVPGHDPRVRDRYPALPGPAAQFATLLG